MLILAGRPVLLIINLQELYNEISTHCGLQLQHFFNNKSALHCLCTHVELARHSLSASSPQIATSFDALKHPQLAINKPIEAPIPTLQE
jgi:hypothetical protein